MKEREFIKMTRPLKFRRIRVIAKWSVLWCGTLRERIKYLFIYLLYKLKYLKRYTYRDMVETEVDNEGLSKENMREVITTPLVIGKLSYRLYSLTNYDVDYFYRKKSKSQKIWYVVRDTISSNVRMDCFLSDIKLCIYGTTYDLPKMPEFRVVKPKDMTTPIGEVRDKLERVPYEVITIDTRQVTKLHIMQILFNSDKVLYSIPEEHLLHTERTYNMCVHEFVKHLSNLKLSDLIIGGGHIYDGR